MTPRWGLSLATSGDFQLAIDSRQGRVVTVLATRFVSMAVSTTCSAAREEPRMATARPGRRTGFAAA